MKYQDSTRCRWPDKRLDFGGALDLADKVHVLALAVFTVSLSSHQKSQMYFKLIVTIETGSMILVGPCQLTTIYVNNQKNQRKEYKNDYSQIQFIFFLMNQECV